MNTHSSTIETQGAIAADAPPMPAPAAKSYVCSHCKQAGHRADRCPGTINGAISLERSARSKLAKCEHALDKRKISHSDLLKRHHRQLLASTKKYEGAAQARHLAQCQVEKCIRQLDRARARNAASNTATGVALAAAAAAQVAANSALSSAAPLTGEEKLLEHVRLHAPDMYSRFMTPRPPPSKEPEPITQIHDV